MVSLDALTIGKQQQWLENQPEPKTQSEIQELSTSEAAYQIVEGRRKRVGDFRDGKPSLPPFRASQPAA